MHSLLPPLQAKLHAYYKQQAIDSEGPLTTMVVGSEVMKHGTFCMSDTCRLLSAQELVGCAVHQGRRLGSQMRVVGGSPPQISASHAG